MFYDGYMLNNIWQPCAGTGEDSIKDDPLQDESPAGGGDGDVPVPVPVPAEAGIQCSLCTYAAPDRLDLVEHIKV